eukprot:Rmarinus@m.19954
MNLRVKVVSLLSIILQCASTAFASESTEMWTEDTPAVLTLTPIDGQTELIVTGVPSGFVFHSLPGTTSSLLNGLYTLAFATSPSPDNIQISVTLPLQCDIDFTLTVSNGAHAIGALVEAYVDPVQLTSDVDGPIDEDTQGVISVTPYAEDSDGSEAFLVLLSIPQLATVHIDGSLSDAVSSTVDNYAWYTVTGIPSFPHASVIEMSITGSSQCDVDFSIRIGYINTEANGLHSVTNAELIEEFRLQAKPDTPLIDMDAGFGLVEDVASALAATPVSSVDTDGSEAVGKVLVLSDGLEAFGGTGVDVNLYDPTTPTPTMVGSARRRRVLGAYSVLYTVTGASFVFSSALSGLSLSAPAQCDASFVLSVRVSSVEANGGVDALGAWSAVQAAVSAVADEPSLSI